MKFSVHHETDTIIINNKIFSVQALKEFLINHYPHLVKKFYVKAVTSNGTFVENRKVRIDGKLVVLSTITHSRTEFQYDWAEIFNRCRKVLFPLDHFVSSNQN